MTTLDLSRFDPQAVQVFLREAQARGDRETIELIARSIGVGEHHGQAEAAETISGLVLPDGRKWGEAAELWQWDDAMAVLNGPERLHYLTRPRGGSKTSDLAGVAIAVLKDQMPPLSAGYAFAQDRDQAGRLRDAVARYLHLDPALSEQIDLQANRIINRATRAWIQISSADASDAWGITPTFIIVDELAQWGSSTAPLTLWEAIVSSIQKVAGCRLVILTSAGAPGHWSHNVLEVAKASPRWRVSEVPGPVPWIDPEDLEEQRSLLTPAQYARLHLNQWTAPEDALVDPSALQRCVTLAGPLPPQDGVRYVIACDLGITNDRSVAAVCHAEPLVDETGDGAPRVRGQRVVLDRMEVWKGSKANPVELSDVEEWIMQASATYNRAGVILDPWQAVGMAQRLRRKRIPAREFNFSSTSIGRLASTLYTLLRDGLLALPPDPELLDELVNVRLRETSAGTMRLDHELGQHDDRAVTLALASFALLERGTTERARVSVSVG